MPCFEVDNARQPGCGNVGGHFGRLSGRHAERPFAHDMLSSVERGEHYLTVCRDGHSDDHYLHVRIIDKRV
jgi:hypothetical protein